GSARSSQCTLCRFSRCSLAFTLPAGVVVTAPSPWLRRSRVSSAGKASESRCITGTLTSRWCSADLQTQCGRLAHQTLAARFSLTEKECYLYCTCRNRFRARYRGNCYVTCTSIGFRELVLNPREALQTHVWRASLLSEPGVGGAAAAATSTRNAGALVEDGGARRLRDVEGRWRSSRPLGLLVDEGGGWRGAPRGGVGGLWAGWPRGGGARGAAGGGGWGRGGGARAARRRAGGGGARGWGGGGGGGGGRPGGLGEGEGALSGRGRC